MPKAKSIIPEFMIKNPDDTFMFLMPLRLKIDYEDYGNSHFIVAVKNLTKKEFFTTELSPELFFTKFNFHQPYRKAKIDKNEKSNLKLLKKEFTINDKSVTIHHDVKLNKFMNERSIVETLGWKRIFLNIAQTVPCYVIEDKLFNIIIPHYTIAIYYYYRTTVMREAVLRCKLDDLYIAAQNDGVNALIIIPKYVTKSEAPFICRFATIHEANKGFEDIGLYIINYIRNLRDKNIWYPKDMPIKAKFPTQNPFLLKAKVHEFLYQGKNSYFVHEIIDDYSYIGFKTLQVLRENRQNNISVNLPEKLPTISKEIPNTTTEILKIESASKRKQHNTIRTKKKSCSSLNDVLINEDSVDVEGIDILLKMYKEEVSNEVTDQSLTESSKTIEKKIRKTRISSEYTEKLQSKKEYSHNFDEFHQYMNFIKNQPIIHNLKVSSNQNMEQVIDIYTDKEHHKCNIEGRPRQYITATFQYKKIYVGLLELENKHGTATSTWIISSIHPIIQSVFDKFLYHFVDENNKINEIKSIYQSNPCIRFATKNHERAEFLKEKDLNRWLVGILSKIL